MLKVFMNKFSFTVIAFVFGVFASGAAPLSLEEVVEAALKQKNLPVSSAWEVSFQPADGVALAEPYAQKIVSTVIGGVQRDQIYWSNGGLSEAWWFSGGYFAEDSVSGDIIVLRENKPSTVLSWLSWISKSNFRGIENRGGSRFAVFGEVMPWVERWPGYYVLSREDDKVKVEALFSELDGHLDQLRYGDWIIRFQRLPAPATVLEIPPKYAEAQAKQAVRAAKAAKKGKKD